MKVSRKLFALVVMLSGLCVFAVWIVAADLAAQHPIPLEARYEFVNVARQLENLNSMFLASLTPEQRGIRDEIDKVQRSMNAKKAELQKKYCKPGFVLDFQPFDKFFEPFCRKT